MEHCELLVKCGFIKPLATSTLEDKIAAVQSIALHHIILQCKAELDQLCSGMENVGILNVLRSNHHIFWEYFSLQKDRLTAGTCIANYLYPVFSLES